MLTTYLQCLALELLYHFATYDNKHNKYIFLNFYVKDQHNVAYNWKVKRKVYKIYFTFL